MRFFPVDTTYGDWHNRISQAARERLQSHLTAISLIDGEKGAAPRLFVRTEIGVFVFIGEVDEQANPDALLVSLLEDASIEICAPVRITALSLFRQLNG